MPQIIEGPGVYFFGIIDILQQWNTQKKIERFLKTVFKCQDKYGISAIPPDLYAKRFITAMHDVTRGPDESERNVSAVLVPQSALASADHRGACVLGFEAPLAQEPSTVGGVRRRCGNGGGVLGPPARVQKPAGSEVRPEPELAASSSRLWLTLPSAWVPCCRRTATGACSRSSPGHRATCRGCLCPTNRVHRGPACRRCHQQSRRTPAAQGCFRKCSQRVWWSITGTTGQVWASPVSGQTCLSGALRRR